MYIPPPVVNWTVQQSLDDMDKGGITTSMTSPTLHQVANEHHERLLEVVNRMPDGSVALRLPEVPRELKDACKQLLNIGDQIKEWLIVSKQVGPLGGDPAEIQKYAAELERVPAHLSSNEWILQATTTHESCEVFQKLELLLELWF